MYIRSLCAVVQKVAVVEKPMFHPLPAVWLRQRRTSSRVWPEHPQPGQRTAGGACVRQHSQGVEPRWHRQDRCAESERGSCAPTLQVGVAFAEEWDCTAACLDLAV